MWLDRRTFVSPWGVWKRVLCLEGHRWWSCRQTGASKDWKFGDAWCSSRCPACACSTCDSFCNSHTQWFRRAPIPQQSCKGYVNTLRPALTCIAHQQSMWSRRTLGKYAAYTLSKEDPINHPSCRKTMANYNQRGYPTLKPIQKSLTCSPYLESQKGFGPV